MIRSTGVRMSQVEGQRAASDAVLGSTLRRRSGDASVATDDRSGTVQQLSLLGRGLVREDVNCFAHRAGRSVTLDHRHRDLGYGPSPSRHRPRSSQRPSRRILRENPLANHPIFRTICWYKA